MKRRKRKLQRREYLSEWLTRVLKPRGMRKAFAEAIGRDQSAVTNMCKGTRQIQYEELLTAARLTGQEIPNLDDVDPVTEDLTSRLQSLPPPVATVTETVPVYGWVSAGSQVERIPTNETAIDYVVAPHGSNAQTRALEIRGSSLGELFNRWLVFFDDEHRPVSPDLLNRLCVVELADGRLLVKKIIRKSGRYDLISNNNEDPIENVQIRWAARVKSMEPR